MSSAPPRKKDWNKLVFHLNAVSILKASKCWLNNEGRRMGRVERGWEWTGKRRGNGKDGGMGGEGNEGDFQKFEILTASMLCSANLHHCAKFRAGRSSRSGYMAVYWFFKMAAVRHLWFWQFKILTARTLRRAKMRHHTKFCANWSKRCAIPTRAIPTKVIWLYTADHDTWRHQKCYC